MQMMEIERYQARQANTGLLVQLKHGGVEAGIATAWRKGGKGGKVLYNLTDTEGLTLRQDTR